MRLKSLLAAALAAGSALGLAACANDPGASSGYAEQFSADNFRRSSDTNGTQMRRDVNRQYTQPSLPSIANRGN
ncbi:hypothetical protein [Methylobacterium sp. sgz302541]|uniref:hypothetical protein n=1 Tax=unclassified Methylobacterium TaxID=2615210 RepID=UPI003D324FC7